MHKVYSHACMHAELSSNKCWSDCIGKLCYYIRECMAKKESYRYRHIQHLDKVLTFRLMQSLPIHNVLCEMTSAYKYKC